MSQKAIQTFLETRKPSDFFIYIVTVSKGTLHTNIAHKTNTNSKVLIKSNASVFNGYKNIYR